MASCCEFLIPRRASAVGYRSLTSIVDDYGGEDASSEAVTVVVGKERREFLVHPLVLEKDLFRVLLLVATRRRGGQQRQGMGGRKRKRVTGGLGRRRRQQPIYVDVDAILFEHLLWLAGDGGENGRVGASLLQRDLEEIVEFYAQD